jgi:hypothetical protein
MRRRNNMTTKNQLKKMKKEKVMVKLAEKVF